MRLPPGFRPGPPGGGLLRPPETQVHRASQICGPQGPEIPRSATVSESTPFSFYARTVFHIVCSADMSGIGTRSSSFASVCFAGLPRFRFTTIVFPSACPAFVLRISTLARHVLSLPRCSSRAVVNDDDHRVRLTHILLTSHKWDLFLNQTA